MSSSIGRCLTDCRLCRARIYLYSRMQLRRASSVDSLARSGSTSSHSHHNQPSLSPPLGFKYGVKTYCGRFMIDQTTQTPENWRTNWSIVTGRYWEPSTTDPSEPGQDLSTTTCKATKATTVAAPAEATGPASPIIAAASRESDSDKPSLDRRGAADRRASTDDGQEEANDNSDGQWPSGARDQARPGREVDNSNSVVTSTAPLQKLATSTATNQANLNRCDDDGDDCGDCGSSWNTSLTTSHCTDQWPLTALTASTDWHYWPTANDNQENDPNRSNISRIPNEQNSVARWSQEVAWTKRPCGEQCRRGPWRGSADQSGRGITNSHHHRSANGVATGTTSQLAWTRQDNGGTGSSDSASMTEERHSAVTKSLPISIPKQTTRTNHQLFGFFGAYAEASLGVSSASALGTGSSQSRLSFNSLEEFNQEIAELMERNQIECKESNESENNGRRAPVTELIDEASGESGARIEPEQGPRWATVARGEWATLDAPDTTADLLCVARASTDQSCSPFAYCDDDLDHSAPWSTHHQEHQAGEKIVTTKRANSESPEQFQETRGNFRELGASELDESFIDRFLLDEECEEHASGNTTPSYQTHIASSTKCVKLQNQRAWVQVLPSPKMIATDIDINGSKSLRKAFKSKPNKSVNESERDLTIANNLIIEFVQQQRNEYRQRQQFGTCEQDSGEFVLKPSYQSAFLPVSSHQGTGSNGTTSNGHHYLQTTSAQW